MGQSSLAVSPSLVGWGTWDTIEGWLGDAVAAVIPDLARASIDPEAFVPGLRERGVRVLLLPECLPGAAASEFLKPFLDRHGRPLVAQGPALARRLAELDDRNDAKGLLLLCRSVPDLEPLVSPPPPVPVVAVFRDLTDARDLSAPLLDWVQGCYAIELAIQNQTTTLRLLIVARDLSGEALADSLRATVPGGWECARLRRDRPVAGGLGSLASLVVKPGARQPDKARLSSVRALDFVHDGGYRSEGDANYSWIWTGPDPTFRIYLGGLSTTGASVRLCVASTREARNLDEAVIMLDGRRLRHRLDRWSPTSGKFTADLPAGAGQHSVLSITVPVLAHDDTRTRKLGVCIDKLEIEA
jgi:hypothetical protein